MKVEIFCEKLLQAKGVLLMPSTVYDFDSNHFRIGFGKSNVPDALLKLEEFLR